MNSLVRKSILNLKPYSSARDEYKGKEGVFLDANESPYGSLNRYPDPYQIELKKIISSVKGCIQESIFVGNGSDEIIDLIFRIFCETGKDKALTFYPTYGMYEISAEINNVKMIQCPLDDKFQINKKITAPFLIDRNLKVIFICSPNNPTGNSINDIQWILENFSGIVVIDEAYIDFSETNSWIKNLSDYSNLIVMQTLSKAFGLAAARIGMAFANPQIINWFNRIKPPYNVSDLNQKAAIDALKNLNEINQHIQEIKKQRTELKNGLLEIPQVVKIYPSDANFLLTEFVNADEVYQYLVSQKIITRNRNSVVKNCIRITVGNSEENKTLLKALKTISQ